MLGLAPAIRAAFAFRATLAIGAASAFGAATTGSPDSYWFGFFRFHFNFLLPQTFPPKGIAGCVPGSGGLKS